MRLSEIARLCGAGSLLEGDLAEVEPSGFSIDSRSVKEGEIYVALVGKQVDGHNFVQEVFDKGACAAMVVHRRLPFAGNLEGYAGRLLFVENTECAFQQMAARILSSWHRPVIGITGSAGKTTIKDMTAHVLGAAGNILKSQGNLNTAYGLPLTVSRMITRGVSPSDFDYAVLEMGMNSYGEIARLTDIAPPEIGIVGNVGSAHIEFFGSLEAVARAKAEMVRGIKTGGSAVLNADDPLVAGMRSLRDDIGIVTFAIDSPADVTADRITVEDDLSGTRFLLRTPDGEAEVRHALIGRHNVSNALAAAAVGHYFGIAPDVIAGRLETVTTPKMRGELITFPNEVSVIDDSYNSNPQALIQAVSAIIGASGFKRRIVVAGEMLELGNLGPELHRQCGNQIADLKIDILIGVRGLASDLIKGARQNGMKRDSAVYFETPEEAATRLIEEARPGDLILVKGSRGVKMETVIGLMQATFGGSDK